jgi:hypothetical protein
VAAFGEALREARRPALARSRIDDAAATPYHSPRIDVLAVEPLPGGVPVTVPDTIEYSSTFVNLLRAASRRRSTSKNTPRPFPHATRSIEQRRRYRLQFESFLL